MALKVERRGDNSGLTTSKTLLNAKPQQCWTCKQRKVGVFDADPNGNPRCPDCQPKRV